MDKYLHQQYGKRINSTTVEVPITNLSGRYFLPDDAILRGKTIVAVFVQGNPSNDAYAPDSNAALPDVPGYRSAYLTLMCQNKSFLENHPISDLTISTSDRQHRFVEADGFNPSKSYITVANPSTPANKIEVGEVFLLTFIYLD